MKLFILNDTFIRNILGNMTIEDNIREIVENIILRFDYSFTNFIYSMFSVYTTYYIQLLDENSHLNYADANKIFNELSKTNLVVDRSNVFIGDIYDILYTGMSFEKTKFKHYFYEDIYNRLENILGVQNATASMEEIFEALEFVFSTIEERLVANLVERDELNPNVVFYLEMTMHGLMIYVV